MSISNKSKKIVRAIEIVLDSFQSHLDGTYENLICSDTCPYKESYGTKQFHKKCVQEYLEVINTLVELL